MHGREGERRIHRRHMWSVPAPSTSSVAVSDSVAAITSDSLSKDGRKICVGDCALFKPPQDTPPFIGIIRRLILGKEENLSLSVSWLYRPADVKLGKRTLLEPTPNEVFYSFHKDEIPAASLLHPCKVAFLPKGVELPSGISSFVCRRVYDIENKCLWWLTDQDYINERQEEVDKLLDKTRLEMYGAVQSGGRSPKRLNGPTGTLQSRPGSESVQNSSSPLPSQVKGKKRDRADQGSDPVERERVFRADDTDSGQFRPEHLLKSEIAKITDKGGLVDFEGVKRLVQLIQPDSAEKKIDLTCRRMLVDVIADTDRFDCLGWFVQLRGLSVLHEWLQEVHKGKIGDGSSPKESDKSAEEFLLVLLCALDKLPVNLHALHTSNVGKSVNHLRSHKNSEIQKKAKTLVDTWKKRVEAEIDMIEAKTGSTRGGSWPNTGRSPARNANGGSFEDPAATLSKSSPPAQPEKLDHLDRKVKGKSDAVQAGSASNINVDLFQGGDGLVRSDEGNVSTPNAIGNEWSRTADDGGKLMEASKVIGSSSGVTPKPGKSYDASFSSINALIESCFKFSEASTTASGGDDFWMNLLASVPAGEMSRSDVSPSGSLRRNSPVLEESCSGNDVKSRHLDEDTAQTEDLNIGEANGDAILKQGNSVDSLHVGGDLGQAELEARKRAQEAEDTTILAKVSKFKESQADRPQKSIARERIRPRPKPLGEKDLGGFEPRPPPVDPLKERAYKKMEVEGVVKKKRRVKRSEEESVLKRRKDMTAEETPMAKEAGVGEIPGRVVAPEVVEVASEVVEVVPVVAEIAQEIQVEGGATGPEPRGEEQPQGGPAPQGGGGVRLTTAIYHARAVSKRLEGEEGLVRAAADRLVEIVDEAAVRSVAKFNEDELLRGLCSAQMEVTTLVGVLLRKMATAKVKSDEAKAQLANFKRDSAGWKKAARSACSRGWQEVEKAKKMQVLAIVYRNVADRAQAELIAVKLELEDERRQVVSLEFQLADEQKKLGDAQKACAVAIERHEEAMTSNEELRAQQIKEKDEADVKIAGLQKELEDERAKAMEERANLQKELEDERAKTASERASLQKELEEERTKTASERAAYPDLYVAAIEKFKGFAEFQMAIDAAVASNVAREVSGGAGPSETTAGGRTEAEVIESFQRSYLYKHEMAEFWDSGWKMFKRKAEELFPDLDLSSVKIDEDDVAQTPMDEGIEEEDLVSSEE